MFLFESIPWYSAVAGVTVTLALILLNEISRRSKLAAGFCFLILPILLTIFVWPTTAAEGTTVGSWFAWVKAYSALAGCLGFMALRYIKGAVNNKYLLFFPAFILGFNIFEAVIREFQTFSFEGMHDGMMIIGGEWNILNGIAGILNIVTICGWAGIYISKDKYKDMVWPDMLWFWIIAYDLWNFAYVYNCVPDHAFYAGLCLLLSCTIPAFFIKKGAWLQHRAHTLGFWMMFVMTFPAFVDTTMFAVKSSHNTDAMWLVSTLSILFNIGVFVYQFHKIRTRKLRPLKDELHTDLKVYQEVAQTQH
ncbi:DUF5692 family protein [Moritella sp.]|uniref:DUF5692 family protein n=1 Tax=Moritella sp. TaxID=78556 RepID=UPI001D36F4BA|nr:DUF5692 family protein [Moritella sp.]MCJ8350675.1 DUF5692 family protein [Moritella sp.]NQZ41016.1 hypothetical protein [Moritella sp.]